jgi:hypothetical protein
MKIDLRWNDDRQCYTAAEWSDHWVDVLPMIYNHRIVLTPMTDPMTYDAGWCYPSLEAAVVALKGWNPDVQKEPSGYLKRAV